MGNEWIPPSPIPQELFDLQKWFMRIETEAALAKLEGKEIALDRASKRPDLLGR